MERHNHSTPGKREHHNRPGQHTSPTEEYVEHLEHKQQRALALNELCPVRCQKGWQRTGHQSYSCCQFD